MDILTPKPNFDPRKKNEAVKFTIPTKSVALKATGEKFIGINRTKDSL